MNHLIYLVYPLLLIALFWGSKFHGRGNWNEDAFSLRQMKALQGFFAVCIMLHHIGQKTSASWLEKDMIIPGLEPFVPYGYYYVGVFLFCSGYGLYKSVREKPDYLHGFARRRILPVVLSLYTTGLIFLLARFLMHEPMDGPQVLYYATNLMLSNPNSWYVIVLPFFYLVFYLSFRFCKRDGASITIIALFTVAYQILGLNIDHNDWWMRGEWWYNSIHFFLIGILFAKGEKKITAHLKKWYWLYFFLFLITAFVFDAYSNYAQNVYSYYGELWNAPDKVRRRCICLVSQILASCSFVFFVFLNCLKIRIGNRFLAFMGSITLEFYLIHGLFLELFSYNFADVAPSIHRITTLPLLVLVVFLPSVPAALLLQKLHHLILRGGKKPASKKEA